MAQFTYLSKEGYLRLREELNELISVGRKEAAEAIGEAREKGDLSENAEYDAAKDAQGLLELKINELQMVLANARILDESDIDTSCVAILSTIVIKNKRSGKDMTIRLVSESEANPSKKWISVTSPIGSGLLGKKEGDSAKIQTPGGMMEFQVMQISYK